MSATYDETYTDDRDVQVRIGGVLITAISALAGILLLLGLIYATGTSARHKTALAVNNCEPSMSPSGLPCNTQQMVIGEYNGIVSTASKLLAGDMAAYNANENNNLAAAEATLTSEAATEQALDRNLAAITYTPQNYANAISLITNAADNGNPTPGAAILLTPQATVIADAALRDNQALATLTAQQAGSTSLTQMRSFNARVAADTATVQAEMKLVSKTLAAPITAAQEP
jgi:hypothetical protein